MPENTVPSYSSRPVIDAFRTTYSASPSHLIRVPGRVNLIGEHVDYNGFPVLPIAIPQDFTAAITPRVDKTIRIANTNPSFHEITFELSDEIPPFKTGHWGNYIKAAVQGIIVSQEISAIGMDIMVEGRIPHSAGLSSSSALVITGALSFLAANALETDYIELADIMSGAERYVGTQGGGMDQAICLLGRSGHAARIDFYPLCVSYVPFPEEYSIVIAHSLVRSTKTKNALVLYNHRPAECRLLTFLANNAFKPDKSFVRMGDLPHKQDIIAGNVELDAFIDSFLPNNTMTPLDIAAHTGTSIDLLMETCRLYHGSTMLITPDEKLPLRKRAMHVFTESARVQASCEALQAGDIAGFGQLMDASHASCDRLYDISIPELDTLTGIMREGGAEGARLTGAGFGGCAVGLVRDDKVENCIEHIRMKYYGDYLKRNGSSIEVPDTPEDVTFAVKPSDGASAVSL